MNPGAPEGAVRDIALHFSDGNGGEVCGYYFILNLPFEGWGKPAARYGDVIDETWQSEWVIIRAGQRDGCGPGWRQRIAEDILGAFVSSAAIIASGISL